MRNVSSVNPSLDNYSGYPMSDWSSQRIKYFEYWYHFDGDLLDEQVSGQDTYPLKLNIFKMACLLHAAFLFGEVPDSAEPLVQCQIEPWGQESPQDRYNRGRMLSDFVNQVWYENNGRSKQQENGVISQVAGGCVFSAVYDQAREEKGLLPIRIETTGPQFFYPVWYANDFTRLLETIVTFSMSGLQANQQFGLNGEPGEEVQYQEHWKQDSYKITVNDAVVAWPKGNALQGDSSYIPYTYIPHIRTGEYYGESLLDNMDELAKEVNARMADLGDIVSDNARQMPAISGSQQPTIRRLSMHYPVIDLGPGMPGMNPPAIHFPTSVQANQATVSYASDLLNIARTQAWTPPVLYGVDEGSQRSYLTLAMRALPLIVHIRQERTLWTTGLDEIARNILRVAAENNINGITMDDLRNIKIHQDWAPILPRDRESEINEIILRFNANLITLEQALEKLGDIRDVKTAINLIKEWMEYQAELEAKSKPEPFGGTGAKGEQAGLSRPTTPQPSISKED